MSVLARLLSDFRDKPENVATRTLYQILVTHVKTRRAFIGVITSPGLTGTNLTLDDCTIELQNRDANRGQPDLVARNRDGKIAAVVEAKFWAGLTENQPVGYLGLLNPDSPGLLVFVAPTERVEFLFSELKTRCRQAGLQIDREMPASCRVGAHAMAVVAWKQTLDILSQNSRHAGDEEAASDLHQLRGLCEHIEANMFLAFRPDELTSQETPRRVLALSAILEKTAQAAVSRGLFSLGNSRIGFGNCAVYRWGYIGAWQVNLQFNSDLWMRLKLSPIWLSTNIRRWENAKLPPEQQKQIRDVISSPGLGAIEDPDGSTYIPLTVPAGAQEEEVVEELLRQIRLVRDLLSEIGFPLGNTPHDAEPPG